MTVLVKVYTAAEGAQFSDAQAAIYGPCIEAIKKREGRATPETIVDEARDEESPLHDYFEWNNRVAGEGYRLGQARELCNHLRVVIRKDGEETRQKAFYHVHVQNADGKSSRGYVGIEEVSTDAVLHEQVLQGALRRYRSLREQYRCLKELEPIHEVIDQFNAEALDSAS
jgi:hypothetical protein